jgi:DNA-binding transcriptional MocR family regulator
VVRRLADMPVGAPDFRLFWDDAYAVHHLSANRVPLLNILDAYAAAGHEEQPLVFASTSKITFAAGGVGSWRHRRRISRGTWSGSARKALSRTS